MENHAVACGNTMEFCMMSGKKAGSFARDMHMDELETIRLEDMIASAESLTDILGRHQDLIREETSFSDSMKQLMQKKKLKKSDVIRVSEVDRVYAYEVLKGTKRPSRDKVLLFAFGMGLTLADSQALIKSSGHNPLNAKVKRDAVLIYAIANGMRLMDVNFLLDGRGLEPLL